MSSMKNTAIGMKKKLSSMKKKIMKRPHAVPQVEVVGIIWMIYGSHFMMIPFGKDLQVSMTKCSREENLRNTSSTPWSTIL